MVDTLGECAVSYDTGGYGGNMVGWAYRLPMAYNCHHIVEDTSPSPYHVVYDIVVTELDNRIACKMCTPF